MWTFANQKSRAFFLGLALLAAPALAPAAAQADSCVICGAAVQNGISTAVKGALGNLTELGYDVTDLVKPAPMVIKTPTAEFGSGPSKGFSAPSFGDTSVLWQASLSRLMAPVSAGAGYPIW